MHTFSMTCKAESLLDRLGDRAERQTAIAWFRDHFITKLYLESYRHGRLVPEERLRIIRDEFRSAGFEVGGCITPTKLSERNHCGLISCYTDPVALARLQAITERTARLFDFFILDDFLFTTCECEDCRKLRADRSLHEARCELMLMVARDRILSPARLINPDVRVILKYPLWYENFRNRGYDVIRETDAFDEIWAGTETRDPDSLEAGRCPQTAASWIQGWMNEIGAGKCGGGWYDPIDTGPLTYVEQARQTILGGAQESLLHCYDYLGTDTPGEAIHATDLVLKYGRADAEAFRQEAPRLRDLANRLRGLEAYGVHVPRNPSLSQTHPSERGLPGFVGMLGIPVRPAASLGARVPTVFSTHMLGFDGLAQAIRRASASGVPHVVTEALCHALLETQENIPAFLQDALQTAFRRPNQPSVVYCTDTLSLLRCPEDLWELTALPVEVMNVLRNRLLLTFGIALDAPGGVSLHLFRSASECCEVIENFHDDPVSVRLRFRPGTSVNRAVWMALPTNESASMQCAETGTYTILLQPRSLLAIASKGLCI